jgi:hypothetical protein
MKNRVAINSRPHTFLLYYYFFMVLSTHCTHSGVFQSCLYSLYTNPWFSLIIVKVE